MRNIALVCESPIVRMSAKLSDDKNFFIKNVKGPLYIIEVKTDCGGAHDFQPEIRALTFPKEITGNAPQFAWLAEGVIS